MGALACASYNHPLAPACTSLYLHYIQTGIAWQLISTASGTEETRRRAPQVVNLARNISGGHLGGRHLEEHQHHELLQRHLQPREGAGGGRAVSRPHSAVAILIDQRQHGGDLLVVNAGLSRLDRQREVLHLDRSRALHIEIAEGLGELASGRGPPHGETRG